MTRRLLLLIFTFLTWCLLFALQKPVFLLAYAGGLADVFDVIAHGLPLDLSMSGYLTVVPALVLLVGSLPMRGRPLSPAPPLQGGEKAGGNAGGGLHKAKASRWLHGIAMAWIAFASVVVALAFVANIALYSYWRFPLDATPLFFILSSPSAAMASVMWWQALLGVLAVGASAIIIFLPFHFLWKDDAIFTKKPRRFEWMLMLVLTAALFLPIRGGVTVSTMNTGKAYYSTNQMLNHAAVNPLLSFMENVAHQEDFASQYRFMDDGKAHAIVRKLMQPTGVAAPHGAVDGRVPASHLQDSLRQADLNIYLIILESFSDTVTTQRGVTPNINKLKREGIYFNHFYANGFRTDRGLVSILLGYPAPGAVSLMKYPRKTAALPSLAGHLQAAGYGLRYYYGGDADFTNMRSFLINHGFQHIVEDRDFPVSQRLSKWGVPDHLLFQRVEADLRKPRSGKQLTVIQTSSSHEPFDVPYHHLADKRLNAFAYADSCVGGFVRYLKKTAQWRNSLVVIIPDHLGSWPEDVDNYKSWRFHVPMVWTGGAIDKPRVVSTFGSQQDIAATLLGQLHIGHADMPFSKDLFDASAPHFAYFMMNDGFGMIDDDNEVVFDNRQRRVLVDKGRLRGKNVKPGQALLQVLFDDIASR